MENKKIKVIIVDDNDIFREGLFDFLSKCGECEIIASVKSGEEFLKLKNINLANIVLIDLMLPGIDGCQTMKKIRTKYDKLNSICITVYEDIATVESLIYAGFKGCVFKNNIGTELKPAMEQVLNKRIYFPHYMKISNENN